MVKYVSCPHRIEKFSGKYISQGVEFISVKESQANDDIFEYFEVVIIPDVMIFTTKDRENPIWKKIGPSATELELEIQQQLKNWKTDSIM